MIVWITEEDALAIHALSIELYGGSYGVRDFTLLQSALAKPKNLFYYGESPTVAELAASYMAGIVLNHPFIDGNKRTGFVVGEAFLRLNGHGLRQDNQAAANAILALASGELNESGLSAWIMKNCQPFK